MKQILDYIALPILIVSLPIGLGGCFDLLNGQVHLLPYTSESFADLSQPFVVVDESKVYPRKGAYFFVVDTDRDEMVRRIPLPGVKSIGGDAYLSPNGKYYFVNSGFLPAGKPSWGKSELIVVDPKEGDVVKRIPLPVTTDQMSQITASGRFLTATNLWEFGKGRQFCLVDTMQDDEVTCFYDLKGPFGKEGLDYSLYFFGLGHIEPREDNYVYFIKEDPIFEPIGSTLYRMNMATQEVEDIFDFQGLTMFPTETEIDEGDGRLYVGTYPALIQSADHDPRYEKPHLEIINLETKQIIEVINLASAQELFGVDGDEDKIHIGMFSLDNQEKKLYFLVGLYTLSQSLKSVVSYNIQNSAFHVLYTTNEVDFNYIHLIKGKLYLRYNDWGGGDPLMMLNPKTGEVKWIELGQ